MKVNEQATSKEKTEGHDTRHVIRKPVFDNMQTGNAQIHQRACAVGSGHNLIVLEIQGANCPRQIAETALMKEL